MAEKILIIGACGQIGTELTLKLREIHGNDQVVASDIREGVDELMQSGPFEILNATDEVHIRQIIETYNIKEVYLMAAMLSATAEKAPKKAWDLNMNSLFHILDMAKEGMIDKIFWPSSIAVFGPTTPKDNTPQITAMEPTTVYGISKQTGERWCEYYHQKFGVDVRSIRYPGIISYKTLPGGGTTDYAIEIFHEALKQNAYTSFLDKDAALPMMYMDDAIKATVEIMQAPSEAIKIRSSYNLAAISFTPEILAANISKHLPDFKISYDPDFRQAIASSWPSSIDDSSARQDWGWDHEFDLDKMTETMLKGVGQTTEQTH
ncbi:NAD-dependent epimerase/dehydratase family protein [Christiangramia sp. OXR-203]|jgi:nucleoside-diphosphate-sugar epimerase|uniref:NAD-dependent epimerase/dehydratase family protein n=1 Tax=Christiangramia sp. OXR-203 TaxID=3100176 RepID=UPI002AC9B875|nr:NAD-dependent epimerase/dehydratase family protein [Christiangramia sp. OXR-203]WPY98935.1 NAD-dependent epimerase/dehydratase family protein [Christiangramia sp. OXR-203]